MTMLLTPSLTDIETECYQPPVIECSFGFYLKRGKMTKSNLPFLALLLIAIGLHAQADSPLRLIKTIYLPGYVGDFEHFAADIKGNRLFLIAEDHKTVEVLDIRTGSRLHTITGFGQPHAIEYLAGPNSLIVTEGDEESGAVDLVNGSNYRILDKIKLPTYVDGGIYNPVNKNYYVESGGQGQDAKTHLLSIIDTQSFKRIGDITLPGTKSEAMAIDHAGAKLYVNLRGPDEIGVVDLATRQLIARWPIPEAKNENALVLDEPNHRLFSASHTPPKLFVFDIETGKVIASLPCAENSDDMGYDPVRKRIYITGDGSASVIKQQDADHYVSVAEVPTGYRAKTSIFVPELNRLYIAVSSRGKRAGGKLVAPESGSKVEVRIYLAQP
jgi:DNA-binding beta-propeller fold protein YncE